MINQKFPSLALNAWYMDDGTIGGSIQQISDVIDLILQVAPTLGLQLNMKKSILFYPMLSACRDNSKFDINFIRAVNGISSLGCPVGTPTYINDYLTNKIDKFDASLSKLVKLSEAHAQIALAILLKCSGFCKMSFLIRTVSPEIITPICSRFDEKIIHTFQKIVGVELEEPAIKQLSLPIVTGGFGIRSTADHAPAAFISSFNGCNRLFSKLLSSSHESVSKDVESVLAYSKHKLSLSTDSSSYDIDVLIKSTSQKYISGAIDEKLSQMLYTSYTNNKDRARFLSLHDSSQGLILDVPLAKIRGFTLSCQELHFFVCSRLGVPAMCNEGDPCPLCGSKMDALGYHMAICKKGPSVVHRHHSLRDVVSSFCTKAAWNPALEINCFIQSEMTPADVFLPRGGSGSEGLALDVMVVHPLQQCLLAKASLASLQGCEFGEKEKHHKYDVACEEEGIDFIPLIVEYFGSWGKEACEFFEKLAKGVASRVGSSKFDILLQLHRQLCVSLIRCNAKAVAKRTVVE
jgi:hypothetical protein